MCGITGKLYFNNNRLVDLEEIRKMTDAIIHRGPDDEGHYINKNIGLGFRRLSIIDLKYGHQPLSNFDGSLWITFNGEIYNFQELRKDLADKGYQFRTRTDTEVIVNLYEEYGFNCVDYLRGMFAFVIWDNRKKILFGVRDRFGIKPFYYYKDDEKFVWGSEIKAIIASSDIEKEIDYQALDSYFAYGYITEDRSIYSKIKKLLPGHYLVAKPYESDEVLIKKYWDIEFSPDYSKTTNEWEELIRETLSAAVKMRLISDVPLGAFLSGGIDSSSVVSLMKAVSSEKVKTFSIGFNESRYDELKYARIIAKKYDTEHHEMIVEPDAIELLDKLVDIYDEPFADSSAIPTYYVSKFASENVTVVLSGDGGDELFAGYNQYRKMLDIYQNPFSSQLLRYLFKFMFLTIPNSFAGKGYSYYRSLNPAYLGAYNGIMKAYEREKIYSYDLIKALNYSAETNKKKIIDIIKGDFITKMQGLDIKTYLVDDILTKVDRVSMANSLEVRVPILDHKFFELTAKIPSNFKINSRGMKEIFKSSMKRYLNDEILNHKKQGFAVPLSAWFKDDLKEYVAECLMDNSARIRDFIKKEEVANIIKGHNIGMRDFSQKIWSLLFLETWLRKNV